MGERIPLSELLDAVTRFVCVGFIEGVSVLQPSSDSLRKSELKDWLAVTCTDRDAFRKLEASGRIKARPTGPAKNSPLAYSKSEIKQAIAELRLAMFVDKYQTHFCK